MLSLIISVPSSIVSVCLTLAGIDLLKQLLLLLLVVVLLFESATTGGNIELYVQLFCVFTELSILFTLFVIHFVVVMSNWLAVGKDPVANVLSGVVSGGGGGGLGGGAIASACRLGQTKDKFGGGIVMKLLHVLLGRWCEMRLVK